MNQPPYLFEEVFFFLGRFVMKKRTRLATVVIVTTASEARTTGSLRGSSYMTECSLFGFLFRYYHSMD